MEARALALPDLAVGQSVVVELSIDDAQLRQFAELSGDFNPLHTDDAFARRKGFQGRVVYGGLLVAKISELIGMRLPGQNSVWASLSLEFLEPVYVNQAVQLEAVVLRVSPGTGLVELKLTVRRAGKKVSKGRAEVIVVD